MQVPRLPNAYESGKPLTRDFYKRIQIVKYDPIKGTILGHAPTRPNAGVKEVAISVGSGIAREYVSPESLFDHIAIIYDDGINQPYVSGIEPPIARKGESRVTTDTTSSGSVYKFEENKYNRNGASLMNEPFNTTPLDTITYKRMGQHFTMGAYPFIDLMSTKLCRLLMIPFENLFRVIANTFEIITSDFTFKMGKDGLEIKSKDGKLSLVLAKKNDTYKITAPKIEFEAETSIKFTAGDTTFLLKDKSALLDSTKVIVNADNKIAMTASDINVTGDTTEIAGLKIIK